MALMIAGPNFSVGKGLAPPCLILVSGRGNKGKDQGGRGTDDFLNWPFGQWISSLFIK